MEHISKISPRPMDYLDNESSKLFIDSKKTVLIVPFKIRFVIIGTEKIL